jgi:hypothetical protein
MSIHCMQHVFYQLGTYVCLFSVTLTGTSVTACVYLKTVANATLELLYAFE